jgi:hypothetical protein
MIAARRIGAEIAAAMRRQDLQAREAVQRSLEDQVLQGEGGVERVADRIRQPAVALPLDGLSPPFPDMAPARS